MPLTPSLDLQAPNPPATAASSSAPTVCSPLEDALTELWDYSAIPDVARFIAQTDCLVILAATIARNNADSRILELSVGILANLACDESFCGRLLQDSNTRELLDLLWFNASSEVSERTLSPFVLWRFCVSESV